MELGGEEAMGTGRKVQCGQMEQRSNKAEYPLLAILKLQGRRPDSVSVNVQVVTQLF
jgi:hypothetical protein